MEGKTDFFSRLISRKPAGLAESINDLRDKEFSGQKLSADEKTALSNFDRYRLNVLNAQGNEELFHQKYRQIQVIASLSDWREFLKPEFSGS
jgi:hypothetical protein